MGGCRCVYRRCQSSTTQSPGLHYFHFPVRDPTRCQQWISNARRFSFRTMDKERLRNKVVCSLHFLDKFFTNEKQDRLVHNAVPTLGFEEDDDLKDDPLNDNNTASSSSSSNNNNTGTTLVDDNIMLIPVDNDNTKFTLPDIGFSGMSYTIYDDDTVLPTSDLIRNTTTTNLIKPEIRTIKTISKTIIKSGEIQSERPPIQLRPVIKTIKTSLKKLEEKPKTATTITIDNNIKKESAYIRMISNNTKQIRNLKKQVRKQSRINKVILHQNRMVPNMFCKKRRQRISKQDILESLKDQLKPSLMAILKLELLSVEDIVLNDNEEKFITDLYTENPECYMLLRSKWKWNLPYSENSDDPLQ